MFRFFSHPYYLFRLLLVVARHLGFCLLDPGPTGPPESEHSFPSQSWVFPLRTIQSQLNPWSAASASRAAMACRTAGFTALRLPSGSWSGSDPLRRLFSTGGFPADYHIRRSFSLYPQLAIGGCPADLKYCGYPADFSHSGRPADFECCGCPARFLHLLVDSELGKFCCRLEPGGPRLRQPRFPRGN